MFANARRNIIPQFEAVETDKGCPLQWRHNGLDGVSNHQHHHCLLSRLFGRRSKKTSKLRVTGLCEGNSPGTGEFPAQMASDAENVSIWWRHHGLIQYHTPKSDLQLNVKIVDILSIFDTKGISAIPFVLYRFCTQPLWWRKCFQFIPPGSQVLLIVLIIGSGFILPLNKKLNFMHGVACPGPVFCLLLGVSSGRARPITGQVTSVTWPVIGWA